MQLKCTLDRCTVAFRFARRVLPRPGVGRMLRLRATLLLMGVLLIVSFVVHCPHAHAQGTTQSDKPAVQASGEPAPGLLFVVQRDNAESSKTARRDEVNTELSLTLRSTLRESEKYQVILYRPDQPRIRRAVLEHALTAEDLTEPLTAQAMQKLAAVVGAQYVLAVHAALDNAGMKTELRLLEDMGQGAWRSPLTETLTFAPAIGKRRLKQSELVALTVDAIGTRLGIASHLAEKLKLDTREVSGKPNKPEKQPKQSAEQAAQSPPAVTEPSASTETSARKAPDTRVVTPDTASPEDAPVTPVTPKLKPKPKQTSHRAGSGSRRVAKNSAKAPAKTAGSSDVSAPGANGTRGNETVAASKTADKDKQKFGSLAPDNNPSDNEAQPILVPPPTDAHPDYVTEAARYRQSGDLASAITSLRRAINDKPRDPALRRQLIQMYQERHLTQAALDETNRALQLAPNDGDLQRLHATALLDAGDAAAALTTLRQAVQAHPDDVAAQVALGDALLADNQYDAALATYRTAERADPKSPLPHRRLARVFAARAASNPTQYAASLDEVTKARALTPAQDIETYQSDYVALMKRLDARLRDLVDELQNLTLDQHDGKRTGDVARRAASDLRERTIALSDYLEKLPPAVGQDATHAHYQQGAALLLQAIGLFRTFLNQGDTHIEDEMRAGRADALSEINAASKLLGTDRASEKPAPSSPPLTNG